MPSTKSILQLLRFPAVFTALSNILSAYLVTHAGQAKFSDLIALMFVSAFIYMGGMIFNDCADYQDDLRFQPFRPLPSGRISKKFAYIMGIMFFVFALILAYVVGKIQFFISLILCLTVLAYDFYLKNTFLRNIIMAACRYLNWLLGLSVVALTQFYFLIPIPIFLYIMGLTMLSTVETGEFNVKYVNTSLGILALSFISIVILILVFNLHIYAIIATIPLLYFIAKGYWVIYSDRSNKAVRNMVGLLIFCIIPLDAIIVFANTHWWQAIIVLLLIIPARLAGKFLYVT